MSNTSCGHFRTRLCPFSRAHKCDGEVYARTQRAVSVSACLRTCAGMQTTCTHACTHHSYYRHVGNSIGLKTFAKRQLPNVIIEWTIARIAFVSIGIVQFGGFAMHVVVK